MFPKNLDIITKSMPSCGFDVIIMIENLSIMLEDGFSISKILDTLVYITKPDGWGFIAEFPNMSKIRLFLQTDEGKVYHQKTQSSNTPILSVHKTKHELLHNQITDGTVMYMLQRLQENGCYAYKTPTPSTLPWHKVRDNILYQKILK